MPHTVMVVDDDSDILDMTRIVLEGGGYRVLRARSGAEALRTLEQSRADLILLDINMPEMDGYEVAKRIRGELGLGDALLVALSGYGEDRHHRLAREAGFDLHVTKPVDASRLEQLLKRPAAPGFAGTE